MKNFDIGIVGLGYVGLTLATALAEVGLSVLGIEKRPEVVSKTNNGIPHFAESGLDRALSRVVSSGQMTAVEQLDSNIKLSTYIITVGTPLDSEGSIRLDMIRAAAQQVSEHMRDGALVILRSTVKIGTARDIVEPILAKSGKSFDIAMCPERTLEGRAMEELRKLPQIVGADSPSARRRASEVFGYLTKSIVEVSNLETAEIVKLIDNTYRDVQFAFGNEVARLCEAYGVNACEIIASGKLGYQRTNVALPGLVGGPCLEKDPHILAQSATEMGVEMEITKAARLVNERQPIETVDLIVREMEHRNFPLDAPIVLMGLAFKGVPATDDLRGSMAIKVLAALRNLRPGAPITLFDPVIDASVLVSEFEYCRVAKTQLDALTDAAVVVIANNHPDLGMYKPAEMSQKMRRFGFIYDYWNHFSNLSEAELGSLYFAVGNTNRGV